MKTMHRFNRILILWTFLGVLHVTNGIDVGFEFQYTTNKEEHLDHPVRFERPLPEWLKGVYMRNGPGQYSMGSRHLEHAFDGYAKPHNIRFQGDGASTAYYTTRFIRSKYYLDSADIHDVKPSMLMLQPSPSFSWIESMLGFVSGFDNMDVNIYNYSGEFVAMSDFWPIYVLNHTNIDTIRRVFADIPTVYFTMNALPYPSSAHPMPEIGTTNYISYVSIPSFVGKTRFIVIRIKSADEREYITEFKMDRLYYVHSFAATEHFAVFFLGPVYTDLWSAFNSWQSLLSIKWAEDEPTHVKVVELRTGAVQSFKTKALFLSHHANAWEVDDNTIVADGVFYPSDAVFSFRVLKTLHNKTLRDKMEADTAILLRHTIRLGQEGSIKMEALPALPEHRFMNHMEYPIINEAFRYKENRYLYGTVLKSDFRVLGNQTLIKRDLKDPRNNLVWMRANHFPHETWFVPRPGAAREDDGILLCDILDGEKKLSYTAVFNATTMELINKGYHPTWNSWTFHGRLFH